MGVKAGVLALAPSALPPWARQMRPSVRRTPYGHGLHRDSRWPCRMARRGQGWSLVDPSEILARALARRAYGA